MQRIILSIIGLIIRVLKGDLKKYSFKQIASEPEENKDVGFTFTVYAAIIIAVIATIYTIMNKYFL